MKSMKGFIVKLEEKFKETIKMSNGVELYMDTKFDEFRHRATSGEVVALPARHKTPVKVGDTLYFHHQVVTHGGKPLPGFEKCYTVSYDPEIPTNSHAIAFTPKGTDEIKALSKWCLLQSVEEKPDVESDSIEIVNLRPSATKRGRIIHACEGSEEFGVKQGDVVGLRDRSDYRIKLNGEEYYRTRPQDMLYVEEEVHND